MSKNFNVDFINTDDENCGRKDREFFMEIYSYFFYMEIVFSKEKSYVLIVANFCFLFF